MTASEESLGYLNINSGLYKTRINKRFKNRKPYAPSDPRLILSFIPGTVVDILVKEGQQVSQGDELLILEAMKMKNRLKCGIAGKVKKIFIEKGTRVAKGVVLIEITAS